MLSIEQKTAIKRLIEDYTALSESFEAMKQHAGADIESPLWQRVFGMFDRYKDQVGESVNGDASDWLSWFIFDNECGANGLKVVINGVSREIKTMDDLYWVLETE